MKGKSVKDFKRNPLAQELSDTPVDALSGRRSKTTTTRVVNTPAGGDKGKETPEITPVAGNVASQPRTFRGMFKRKPAAAPKEEVKLIPIDEIWQQFLTAEAYISLYERIRKEKFPTSSQMVMPEQEPRFREVIATFAGVIRREVYEPSEYKSMYPKNGRELALSELALGHSETLIKKMSHDAMPDRLFVCQSLKESLPYSPLYSNMKIVLKALHNKKKIFASGDNISKPGEVNKSDDGDTRKIQHAAAVHVTQLGGETDARRLATPFVRAFEKLGLPPEESTQYAFKVMRDVEEMFPILLVDSAAVIATLLRDGGHFEGPKRLAANAPKFIDGAKEALEKEKNLFTDPQFKEIADMLYGRAVLLHKHFGEAAKCDWLTSRIDEAMASTVTFSDLVEANAEEQSRLERKAVPLVVGSPVLLEVQASEIRHATIIHSQTPKRAKGRQQELISLQSLTRKEFDTLQKESGPHETPARSRPTLHVERLGRQAAEVSFEEFLKQEPGQNFDKRAGGAVRRLSMSDESSREKGLFEK